MMDNRIVPELEIIAGTLQERIRVNLKLVESFIVRLLKEHLNDKLSIKLIDNRENLFHIKNILRTYRPSPLVHSITESEKLNQIINITFFLEIILIESNMMIENNQIIKFEQEEEIKKLIDEYNLCLERIKLLFNNLLNFDKLVKRENIYDDIWNSVRYLYSDNSRVKELLASCKKLNLFSIEKSLLPNFKRRNHSIALSVFEKRKIPIEFSEDPSLLLTYVDPEGVDSKESLMQKTKWSEARVERTLEFLIKKGICKKGADSIKGKMYYFPGL